MVSPLALRTRAPQGGEAACGCFGQTREALARGRTVKCEIGDSHLFGNLSFFRVKHFSFYILEQQCNRLTRRVQSPRLQLGNLSPTGKFITYWIRLDSDFSSSAFPCVNNTFPNSAFKTQSSMQQSCNRFSSEELCFPLVTYCTPSSPILTPFTFTF